MKNEYLINHDHAVIYLKRKSGASIETLVDVEDLNMLLELNFTWNTMSSKTGEYYPMTTLNFGDGSRTSLLLHRFIMNFPNSIIDHINHDTLDNRKSNLRMATKSENGQNRKSAQKNSKSGIRGVHYHPQRNKWVAQVMMNQKTINLGHFNTIEEATNAVALGRKSIMPFAN